MVFVFGPAYGELRRLNGIGRWQRAVEFDRDLRLVVICLRLVVVSIKVSGLSYVQALCPRGDGVRLFVCSFVDGKVAAERFMASTKKRKKLKRK